MPRLSAIIQEVVEHPAAFGREYRFRMELDAVYRVFLVLDTHDLAVVCNSNYLEALGYSVTVGDKGVIAGDLRAVADALEQGAVRVKADI